MISKRSLLLVLYLAITGCSMDCVEPGLQSRSTSVNVNVPVRKADEGVKIHWVDSGQVISKDEKIKFTLGGSLNFCPPKEGKNPRKVLVPAVFCADGSIPNYSKAANINDVPNNYGVDEKGVSGNELCGGRGFGSNRRYVDTGIKVNPGDKLSFSLVSREITIDYDNPGEKVSFDDNCYRTETGDKKVLASEILNISDEKGKEFFCEGKDGKRNKVKFLPLDKTKVKERKVLVGNGYTPYDNKVHFNKNFIKDDKPWVNGALLDLRRARVGLNELCGGKNCNLNEIKKYGSYELNCYYQNICYTKEGIFNNGLHKKGNRNCVSSIRYKKYDAKNSTCNMYSHLKEVEDKLKEIKENKGSTGFTSTGEEDIENIFWAEALVAKIGSLEDQDTAQDTQCLPEEKGVKKDNVCSQISDNFEDFSLRLNYDYTVVDKVTPGSDVMLAIADYGCYRADRGGYHVEVTRSCEYINGKKLYVYLGNEPPKDLSSVGTNDFKAVGVRNGKDKYTILDVISGEHFQNGESKKIYFGIDVSNVEKEDITDEKGKYYENNEYNITLFVKRKINDFVSSNVNKVFDFIKKEVIGDSVKDLYKGYAKGLLQGVRALLTLYVIFTVVGYMLGMIQLSKFDFIVRMMKIAFIAFAFSDNSWKFFGTTLSKFFMDGSTHLVDSFSGYIGEGGKRFAFLDLTAGILLTGETWLKFLSLIFAGPFGFIAFLIILHASFMFLKCIISATFRYVISTVLVAFLLSLTPLFIVFILFQQTKSLFDNWIKTLAYVAVQPMILFSSLSILNQLMYSVLYNLTNFSACYQCLISINFLSYDFCLMKSILPLGYSPGTSVDVALSDGTKTGGHFAALPIDLIQVIIYFIIGKAMEVFVSASETMAQAIFSAGFGIAGSVGDVASSASQAILSTVGLDDATQGNKERGIEGMIPHVKRMTSQDRAQIEYKLPKTQSETPGQGSEKNSGGPGDRGKEKKDRKVALPETKEQLKEKKGPGAENKDKKEEEGNE
ncbi:conjugal transfer protein TrbL [Wolbachia endosymbiont of Madathamugadia hiepei]|uniref:type IV secretion system protein n=1 Tax=Wolbachia endosymbiont of Madathamugadia hiepei TaxID=1241303 RepID=UPI00158C5558|nr:type IV secretion system protein [Wolbachia endosymbiont of Madathamugadia hiepei]NUX00927.1 conjugal transfer protein TrbL [Wolbachia endosymbiont of Madathamugadia hiepei]